ncbi:MAG: phosphate ABC transporter permease PstA [Frankiaceae bacterium]|nr:phosphate ABC transporter permease PstA [Frankiaceae bacterium]MBV9368880.1 phosphate ABC transporter permease PstA [Frankiales bacterium]
MTQILPVQSPPPVATRPRPVPRRLASSHWPLPAIVTLVAAAVGALSLSWLVLDRLFPLSGFVGYWLVSYVVFLAIYAFAVARTEGRVAMRDRTAAVLVTTAGVTLVGVLALVVGFVAVHGWRAAAHVNFFTRTTAFTGPNDPLDHGGVLHAMIGTAEQVGLAMAISVPIGFATAIYLSEMRGAMTRVIRTVVETMTAIPSILAGLFVFATLILTLGFNRCGLAAACALSVEMLPVVTRTAEVILRLVPAGLREASYALGGSQWRTVRKVVLPTARAGLITAVLLGVARVVGETSPILLTAGFTNELNKNPLSGPQVSLPLFAFTEVRFPLDNAIARAFGAALVLLVLVVVFFTTARVIGGRSPAATTSRRERERRTSGPHRASHVAVSRGTATLAVSATERDRSARRSRES